MSEVFLPSDKRIFHLSGIGIRQPCESSGCKEDSGQCDMPAVYHNLNEEDATRVAGLIVNDEKIIKTDNAGYE